MEFGGESPLTIRARCGGFRNCPNPLGIVTAEQLNKLEFGGESPLTMRYKPRRSNNILWAPRPVACLALRMEFGKLEFDELKNTLVIFNHGTKTYNKSKNNTNNQNSSSN